MTTRENGYARVLESPGFGIRTPDEVAALAGFKTVISVYNAVNAGRPVAGRKWEWRDSDDRLPPRPRRGYTPIPETPPPYAWRANGEQIVNWPPAGVDLRKWQPPPAPREYVPRTRAADSDVQPLNPFGPGLLAAAWGIPPFAKGKSVA